MEIAMIKKMGITASVLILTIILALGCNYLTQDDDNPMVSDPDEVFLTLSGVTITRADLYSRAKTMEGISHLLNYIDETLLEDILDDIDAADVEEELKKLKYGTTDQELIDEIEADEERLEEIERNFYFTIVYAGFNPDKPEEVDRFIRLTLAKEYATRDQIIDDFEADPNSNLEAEVEIFYNELYRGDVTAIELIFQNLDEFDSVMDYFNLVPNFESDDGEKGIGLYHGDDIAIEDAPTEHFTSENTDLLSNHEVFEYYVRIYNYLHRYRDQLDETITHEDLDAFEADFFTFNYKEMSESRRTGNVAHILFDSLSLKENVEEDDDTLNYTIDKRRYNQDDQSLKDVYVMYYKLDVADRDSYSSLTPERQEALTYEYIDSIMLGEFVFEYMVHLRSDHNFVLHDEDLHASYTQMIEQITGPDFAVYEKGDGDLVASLDPFDVDVDTLFDYMIRRIGALTTIELFKEGYLLQSEFFEARFGSSRNLLTSRNENVKAYRDYIEELKVDFSGHFYSQIYSWNEFLYLAYGVESDEDFLTTLVLDDLIDYLVPANIDYDHAQDYVNEQYDNYIHLVVEHIVIYVDFEGDLIPDDFDDYLASLDADDKAAYTILKGQLENALIDAINEDDMTLSQVVRAYNKAIRDEDDNQWAVFKNYGFKVRYENILGGDVINYNRTKAFDDKFVDNLYRIYEAYTSEEFASDTAYLDDRIFTSSFGLHLVNASKNSEILFTAPSAQFDNPDGDFDERWENDSDIPNQSQLEVWIQMSFENRVDEDGSSIEAPPGLNQTLTTYFGSYYNALFASQDEYFDPFGNMVMIDIMIEENAEFSVENDRLQTMIRALKEIYEMVVFPN